MCTCVTVLEFCHQGMHVQMGGITGIWVKTYRHQSFCALITSMAPAACFSILFWVLLSWQSKITLSSHLYILVSGDTHLRTNHNWVLITSFNKLHQKKQMLYFSCVCWYCNCLAFNVIRIFFSLGNWEISQNGFSMKREKKKSETIRKQRVHDHNYFDYIY